VNEQNACDGVSRDDGGREEVGPGEVTRLLEDLRAGDPRAFERLFPLVYDELRRRARWHLSRGAPTLATTDLVHETYLKLLGTQGALGENRRHFFNIAGRAMRQVVVDVARRQGSAKRGGGVRPLRLDETCFGIDEQAAEDLALHEALERLQEVEPRLCQVVELRFFAGLSVEETAEALAVTGRTVKRDWRKARAFLYQEMTGLGDG